ncbi:hypothetical protein BSNK01_11740 [Bacillaceae bacterium]
MRKVFTILLTLILCFSFFGAAFADVWVNGYFRSDGTWVKGHWRSSPNGNPYDNYSFPGNYNPYTGKRASGNIDTYLNNYYFDLTPRYRYYTPSYYNLGW